MKTITHLAAGLTGGLLGTRLMLSLMKRAGKIPPSLRPPAPSQDPGDFMINQAEKLAHRALPPRAHHAAAHSLQWAYGVFWPLVMGALAGKLGLRSPGKAVLAGAGLGAVVWAIGSVGWLPATGLTPPIQRQPIGGTLSNLMGHVAYGTVAALPLAALESEAGKRVIS
jgi:hypothetical protein